MVPGLGSGATGRVASAAGGPNGMVGVDGARRTTTKCWYSQFADGLPCKESNLTSKKCSAHIHLRDILLLTVVLLTQWIQLCHGNQ